MNNIVLDIRGLKTLFESHQGVVTALDGVNLTMRHTETLGIVGESGCGKTVLALSIMRLVPSPPGRIAAGEILLDGRDLLSLPEREMRALRGNEISMIFQEPMNSLNPVLTVGNQLTEAIRLHERIPSKAAVDRAKEMLHLVGIPSPDERLKNYPHQLSGGMRQRVMIAMALSCSPRVMLADEPTTALDVTIQAQILDLMTRLKEEKGTSILLITHDLGVVAETAQSVAVMYTGKVVETAPADTLFATPLHPYTEGLMASTPNEDNRGKRLTAIPGTVPPLYELPPGCTFQDRCPYVMDICRNKPPDLTKVTPDHQVRCWRYA